MLAFNTFVEEYGFKIMTNNLQIVPKTYSHQILILDPQVIYDEKSSTLNTIYQTYQRQ